MTMNEHDRKREEQLSRLFETAGPVPTLTPDPVLPMRVRALAASAARDRNRSIARPRWAWVSLASAAFALSIVAGGYVGYRAWASTEPTDTESTGDAEVLVTVWLQSGFVEDLDQSTASDEVTE
jgi:hypothetical protein